MAQFNATDYMLRQLMDDLFGPDKDEISKQNALTRYSNTINLYAGQIGTNWDSKNLASRKEDIDTFHQKIRKGPNYDPIIEDHVDVIKRQIDDRVRINNNYNLNIDRLKNIDSQLISIADEYRIAYDKRKDLDIVGWDASADDELRIIADKAKKVTIDRSDASSTMQMLDPDRWRVSSELQFLDKDAKTNSAWLMETIRNDGFIDDYEYGVLIDSIDADDPNIPKAAMSQRKAQVLEINEGLVTDTQALADETNSLYELLQDAKKKGSKDKVLQELEDEFHGSLNSLMRKKHLIGEGSGKGMEDEVWDNLYPDGEPWGVNVKSITEEILEGKKTITDLPEKYFDDEFGKTKGDGISAEDWGIEEIVPAVVGASWIAQKTYSGVNKAYGYISTGLKITEESKIAGFLQDSETKKAANKIFKLQERLKNPALNPKQLQNIQNKINELANIFTDKHGYKFDASKADIIKLMKNSDKWNIWQFKNKMMPIMRQAKVTIGDVAKPLAKLGKGAWWTLIPFEGGMELAEKMGIEGPVGQIATGVATTKLTTVARKSITKKMREKGIWAIKDKLKDPKVAGKVGKILLKKAPWVAAKMGIGAVGAVVPEPVSTAVGLGLLVWTAKDIYGLIVNDVPELYYVLFPEEK